MSILLTVAVSDIQVDTCKVEREAASSQLTARKETETSAPPPQGL